MIFIFKLAYPVELVSSPVFVINNFTDMFVCPQLLRKERQWAEPTLSDFGPSNTKTSHDSKPPWRRERPKNLQRHDLEVDAARSRDC